MTPQHAAALTYVERGWHVVALHHVTEDGRCSCGQGGEGHATGKHPRERKWQDNPALSAADVMTLWERWPEGNVGIATGATSGIFVLDLDPKNGGDETLRLLIESHGELPDTYVVATGGGGRHYYFTLPDFTVTNSPGRLGDGLDIRGNGGQVVAPPSRTPQGGYEVADGDAKVLPAPSWLLDLIRPPAKPERVPAGRVERASDDIGRYVAAAVASEVRRVEDAPEGRRNDTLNRATFSLAQIAAHADSGLDVDELATTMTDAGLAAGLDAHEVAATVRSGIAGGLASPRELWPPEPKQEAGFFIPFEGEVGALWPTREWDDLGNAERIEDHYGDRLRWVRADKKWAVYTDGRWVRRNDEEAGALVARMVRLLEVTEAHSYDTTPNDKGETERDRFVKWSRKQGAEAKMNAALNAAKRIPELVADVADFDARPMLLNTPTGALDLATGELHHHDPSLMLTAQTSVGVDLSADCPRWEAFLERVMPDQQERDFLARVVGYSLTGQTGEQVMFMHHGAGANGKSVFLKVLGSIFGDYGQVVPRQTLLVKKSDGIPTDIARMVGKRFLQTNETATGRQLDEEVVKSITGEDTQVARHLHGDEFEFVPQGKLHYTTNHLPYLSDAESIWRRIVLIRWGVVIPEGERDRGLATRIIEQEREGVLAWALRGCAEWVKLCESDSEGSGLQVPLSCRLDRDAWKDESDVLGEFINDCLAPAPGERTAIAVVYDHYRNWAQANGHSPMASTTLSKRLKERDLTLDRHWSREEGKHVRYLADFLSRRDVQIAYPGTYLT